MSFDIFVQCFRDGEAVTFKRAIFDEIFDRFAVTREAKFMRVEFPDGGGADIYVDEGDALDSVMFNHCGGDAFFDALYQLADRVKGIIYWADEAPCSAITDAAVLEHLPEDLVEGVGPPALVRDRDGITDAIERS